MTETDKEKIEEDDLCQECGTKIKDHTGEDLRDCIAILEEETEPMKRLLKKMEERYGLR